jgi:hypothetical protein
VRQRRSCPFAPRLQGHLLLAGRVPREKQQGERVEKQVHQAHRV